MSIGLINTDFCFINILIFGKICCGYKMLIFGQKPVAGLYFFHFKAKQPRYGHFLDFTSTEAFVNIGGEHVVKGCKFELITLNIFKSIHLLFPDQICTSQGEN